MKRHNSNLEVRHYENTNACAKNRSYRLKFLTLSEGAPPKKRKNRRGKKSKSSHISPLPHPPGHLRAPSLFRMPVPPAIIIRLSIRTRLKPAHIFVEHSMCVLDYVSVNVGFTFFLGFANYFI